MSSLNKKLVVVALLMVVASVLTYMHSVRRTERFEAGTKFLQNLNPDEIAGIEIRSPAGEASGDEAETVTLSRQGDEYVLRERNGYRAKTEEVNRLVRDLLDVTLQRRMGVGEELASELGLVGDDAVGVVLTNANGDEMVGLRLGDTADDGGRYLQRTSGDDQAIYRSEGAVTVASDPTQFLRKEILDHASSEVVRLAGPDFVLAKQQDSEGAWQGALELEGDLEENATEVNRLASLLSRLEYDEVFLASAPEVAPLRFDRAYVFDLEDQSGYRFDVASAGDDTYVRIGGVFNVDRLEVGQDESDEELEAKADVLRRSDEMAQFQQYHGSWVYRLSSADGEILGLRVADLTSEE